ncbi:MAG: CsbD family protein [Vulcanimicrobiota bacterium]
MNEDILKGKWSQLKGEVQRQWGKLTKDDLDVIKGDSQKLMGMLQERYGYAKEEAERHYEAFQQAHAPTRTDG